MNRAEIAREQTNKQRQIIEYHRVTMAVFNEINNAVSNGEYKASCLIPDSCFEQIVNNLREEGFIVEELKVDGSWTNKRIIIFW